MVSDLRRRLVWGVAIAALLAPGVVRADPSAADRETARGYMADGRAKRSANDLKAALRAFEAADAIMHVPTTGLEVARTQAMLGLLVEARDGALRVARSPARRGEPAPFVDARRDAQQLADGLEARIPSIRVTIQHPPPGVSVSIDGTDLPHIAIGLPRKLDPGNHVVIAKAGSVERTINVQVLEREAKEVPIDLGAPAQPTTTGGSETGAPTAAPPEAPSHHGPWVPMGITGLSLGGVGIVLGAVTGAMSISQTNTIQAQCTAGVCPPTLSDGSKTNDALTRARLLATLSDIGFIAGGVLAAAGVVFVIVGSTHSSKPSAAFGVVPGGVTLGGTF
jgi:hypothetical protein